MAGYTIRRFLAFIPLIWAIATITFFLMHMVPGGPFDTERPLPEATKRNLEAKYHLDGNILEQYGAFLKELAKGDLGVSLNQDRPVTDIIRERIPKTIQLGFCAFIFALAGGLFLGILASTNQNRWPDYVSVFISTVGAAVPNFVVGVFCILFFALKLGWFDVLGWELGNYHKMVLPTVALGLLPLSFIARITRASMLEVLRQDYVRTARSKGLVERTVIMRHVVRNGLIPVLTVAGPIFAGLVTGSFVIERFFAVGGVGTAFVDAVALRDYGMIMGTTLLFALAIAIMNLLVDLAYGLVDPRIRY